MIKKISIYIILTILILTGNAFNASKKPSEIRHKKIQTKINENRIKKLDALINKFEKGFFSFAKKLKLIFKKYKSSIGRQKIKRLIEPLNLFITNMKNNKYKNNVKYTLMRKKNRDKQPFYRFKNNNFFRYDILPKAYRGTHAAGFKMQTRVLYLNPKYNPDKIWHNIIAFHELVHALQDTTLRNHLRKLSLNKELVLLKKYLNTLKPNTPSDPDLEPVAYAFEIELLNIILGGFIQKAVKAGQIIDSVKIARLININTRHGLATLRSVLKYAIIYFHHDCGIYSYTRYYRAIVLKDYLKIGFKFFPSENKFIKPAPRGLNIRKPGSRYKRNYRNRRYRSNSGRNRQNHSRKHRTGPDSSQRRNNETRQNFKTDNQNRNKNKLNNNDAGNLELN